LGEVLRTPHWEKKLSCYESFKKASDLDRCNGRGTWNVRSLYRSGSLTMAASELARYKLDLVGVQEVRWDRWGTWQGIIIFPWKRK